MGALDTDTAVPDVLRSEANDFTAAARRLQREFHSQALLRPERPIVPILLNLLVGPIVVSLRLGQPDTGDAFSRVALQHGRHREAQQAANGLQTMPLGGG